MNTSPKRLRFPVWKFLNQRVFDPETPAFFMPHKYWRYYKCQHLETCWMMEYQPEPGSRNP